MEGAVGLKTQGLGAAALSGHGSEEGGRQHLRQDCGHTGRWGAQERPFWDETRVWTLPRGRGLEGGPALAAGSKAVAAWAGFLQDKGGVPRRDGASPPH